MNPRVISVVSGKGGSGKTLFTAVLGRTLAEEGQRVLLVDMDIFVRGLTVLLHRFRKASAATGTSTISDLLGIFDKESQKRGPVDGSNLALIRFGEADVAPAVSDVSAPLDYDDTALSEEHFCYERIQALIDQVSSRYDYILLDNRAGMDSLVAASCRSANFVLSIAEDDDVGRQTNVNLVNFLRFKKGITRIYTVINKGRRIHDFRDVQRRKEERAEFSVMGVIPFDGDVMETFGSERFWVAVNETLYFRALIEAWNALPADVRGNEINISRYRFPPRIFMQKSQGRFTLIERILRLYSVLFIIAGMIAWVYPKFLNGSINEADLIALSSIAMGVLALILSTVGFKQFLFLDKFERHDER